MEVEIRILFFASARDIVGKSETTLIVKTPIDYKSLFNTIIDQYSLEKIGNNSILAINKEFIGVDDVFNLKQGDEVAIIPPLSGG